MNSQTTNELERRLDNLNVNVASRAADELISRYYADKYSFVKAKVNYVKEIKASEEINLSEENLIKINSPEDLYYVKKGDKIYTGQLSGSKEKSNSAKELVLEKEKYTLKTASQNKKGDIFENYYNLFNLDFFQKFSKKISAMSPKYFLYKSKLNNLIKNKK